LLISESAGTFLHVGEVGGGAVRRWKGRIWNGNGGGWGTDIEGAGVEEEEEVVLETHV